MRSFIIHLVFVLFFLPFAQAGAKIIHVPADSSTIQAGINGAVDGDTVLVARGHYYERINFLGKAILVASNFIFDNDTISIDSTIIDADTSILGVSDTGSVVVFVSGEDSNSLITGFIIQNGVGTLSEHAPDRIGGGIYCDTSSPTISNNTITINSARLGGGILCYLSPPTITNNTITGNSAKLLGGGIYCQFSSPAISNNRITGNIAVDAGGGIICLVYSSPSIVNNIIAGNSSSNGGAIYCVYSSPCVSNNTITGNSASNTGGIHCYGSSPVITNNIISNSPHGEGIACQYGSAPTISYNDVWSNADGNFLGCPAGVGDTTWGNNFNGTPCDSFYNIIRDPIFADTITFELLCNSPCIDAGDPSIYVPIDSGGCRIDIGAREYPYILGDANSDGTITPKGSRMGGVNIGDIVYLINYLFVNGSPSCPYHAADTNCDGLVDIADVVCLINYLFINGLLPCS